MGPTLRRACTSDSRPVRSLNHHRSHYWCFKLWLCQDIEILITKSFLQDNDPTTDVARANTWYYQDTTRNSSLASCSSASVSTANGLAWYWALTIYSMAYFNFCILVHRPWTSKSSQPDDRIGPGHHHARGVCRSSAAEIASLLRMYESHYGFRKMNVYVVNIIFSASLILIFGLIAEEIIGDHHDQDEKANVARDLNTCFRALDELGQSFESAKRNHEHLLTIQKHWSQRKRDAKVGAKRRSQLQSSSNRMASKRSRPSRDSGLGSESAASVLRWCILMTDMYPLILFWEVYGSN